MVPLVHAEWFRLRVGPRSLCSGQTPYHELDHGEAYQRGCGSGQILEIPREAAVATDPCQSSLDDPALGDDREAFLGARTLNDFNPPCARLAHGVANARPLVSSIGKDNLDERKSAAHPFGQNLGRAIPVLYARRMNHDAQQEPLMVGQDMALDALGLLARIEADGIKRGPPFAADLAL